jgi:uncharacterized membrane protein YeaQ/YmgE (transglycosylase-associated protein family)
MYLVISWLIFGLIVGGIARLLKPGSQPMGCLLTSLLGIAGSFVFGYIATILRGHPLDSSEPAGYIGGIIGAILILIAYGMLTKPSPPA